MGADSQDEVSDMIQESGSPGLGTMVAMGTGCHCELRQQSVVITETRPLSRAAYPCCLLIEWTCSPAPAMKHPETYFSVASIAWDPEPPNGVGFISHPSLYGVPRVVSGT